MNTPTGGKTIAIIGGGAAGMMAAAHLVESKKNTTANSANPTTIYLFDKNDHLGAKVIISGGGRCNVTTGISDIKKLLENYPRGAKFLRKAMYDFPPPKVISFFESHNVPLKTEDDLRVFPRSDNGHDIVEALEKILKKGNTEILMNTNVTKIEPIKNPKGKMFRIHTKNRTYDCDILILTTGGNAYRQTGSTGDGYAFARSLGHTITQLAPSLSSYVTKESYPKNLAGVSFQKTEITLTTSTGKTFTRTGPLLFTHRGVSGPAIFALSSLAAYEPSSTTEPLHLEINFLPDITKENLLMKLQSEANAHGKKELINFLDMFLPRSLCEIIIQELQQRKKLSSPSIQAGQINAGLKREIASIIQQFPLTVIGKSAGEEFVTAGGVSLREVDPNTMESKICKNLYFAGELLDIDGFTGGFNLQASWATGALAGASIAKRIS